MRVTFAVLLALAACAAIAPTKADPYAWCAQYGGRTGGTNCYFVTLAQCQAAVSGAGGFCRPNGFYTGSDAPPRKRKNKR